MSDDTVLVNIDGLRQCADTAVRNNKAHAFISIALQWAEQASDEIERLNKLCAQRTEMAQQSFDRTERAEQEAAGLRARLGFRSDTVEGIPTGYGEDEIDRLTAEINDLRLLHKEATERESRWMLEASSLRVDLQEAAGLRTNDERYRWLSGDAAPQHSTRWSRWTLEYWDGANGWRPMKGAELSAAIDAAIKDEQAARAGGGQ